MDQRQLASTLRYLSPQVDMDQRQLAFSINGGPSVLATKASPNPNP